VPLSPEPEVTSSPARSPAFALAAPAMGRLARAYVNNDVDFTGSARRALAIAESMVGDIAHGGHGVRSSAWPAHGCAATSRTSRIITTSNAFYRRARYADGLLVRLFPQLGPS
jgi:hypothetical protein